MRKSISSLRNLNSQEQANEILRTEETIFKITGEKTTYFRPPYGKFNRALLRTVKNIDYKMVLWSLLTYDYKNDIAVFNRSLQHLKNNSLVVMHDHPKCTETVHAGLTKLVEAVFRNNFSIGVPGECLK
ncbi:MAG: polysaccharide deacetylase family protein [Ignavibacteriales bacterium]|nr:polysaccharide deacetylase family protein [Ignavibacteriales bacterium]